MFVVLSLALVSFHPSGASNYEAAQILEIICTSVVQYHRVPYFYDSFVCFMSNVVRLHIVCTY